MFLYRRKINFFFYLFSLSLFKFIFDLKIFTLKYYKKYFGSLFLFYLLPFNKLFHQESSNYLHFYKKEPIKLLNYFKRISEVLRYFLDSRRKNKKKNFIIFAI
jgi:hypothetical protein